MLIFVYAQKLPTVVSYARKLNRPGSPRYRLLLALLDRKYVHVMYHILHVGVFNICINCSFVHLQYLAAASKTNCSYMLRNPVNKDTD